MTEHDLITLVEPDWIIGDALYYPYAPDEFVEGDYSASHHHDYVVSDDRLERWLLAYETEYQRLADPRPAIAVPFSEVAAWQATNNAARQAARAHADQVEVS